MINLNRNTLAEIKPADGLHIGAAGKMAEKVLQFGEGNFLRAFVDYMIDELNSNGLFNGSIVVVQPIASGMVDALNAQDGLYTLFLRGLEDGKEICTKKIITSVSRGINPYIDYESYIDCMKNPELRFIVSNTTEAGIAYNPSDKLEDRPQASFPAKATAMLYERYKLFNGDKSKGFVFIPCELIDYNGSTLKKIVLQYASEWKLGEDFTNWVINANYFTNTLVDRIVTGYPRDEAPALTEQLGYSDNLINTGEIFHFWVIEGPKEISEEIPFDKIGLNVIWTDDATPYKLRKVRILNGAHTMSVLAAYLCGKNTVGELMADELFVSYLRKCLFDEIIPTLDLDYADLKSFADAVFDRFANPYIKHYLMSISLNSVSKFKARVLPTILEYNKRKGFLPELLTFSFAALIAFYRGTEIRDGALIGSRTVNNTKEEYKIQDEESVLEIFKNQWTVYESENCASTNDNSNSTAAFNLAAQISSKAELWGLDLTTLDGFVDKAGQNLDNILACGADREIKRILEGYAKSSSTGGKDLS